MKMILQKHTSKFVAGLFNSLGITACVALTSCGDENKGKQTENQGEELKNKLKTVDFYKSLAEDEGSLKTIADWLNSKNYGSDYILTAKDLQEIFNNNPDKLNEVAGKLEVKLTESDSNRDDENQKSEISLKFEGEGKVIITKVAGNTKTDFVFGEIKNLQSFVENLKDKEITKVEGTWSLSFDKENVKICGHETGFKVTDCFGDFLNCFNTLVGVEKLKITKLSLKIEKGSLSLNDVACNDDYYKGSDFWSLVNKHTDLFGITDENKFEIEKNDKVKGKINGKDEATVTINGFESSLLWKWVVNEEGKTLVANSGWNNIFKLKDEGEPAKEVTVEFENGKCTCKEIKGYEDGVVLKDLAALEKLVKDLNGKKVTIGGNKNFSLAFDDKKVKVCGDETGFEVMKESNFATLLQHVAALKDVNAVGDKFKIEIAAAEDDIKLGGNAVDKEFMKTANFWEAVRNYKKLFGELLPINVDKDETGNSKNGKIGETVIEVEMFDGEDIAKEWKEIFQKKEDKK